MKKKRLRALMFGWEFPPQISGGLGTACYGLVSGLIQHNVDVLFVVPKLYGKEDTDKFRFVDANKVAVNFDHPSFNENLKKISYLEINSRIIPYVSPEEFATSQESTFSDVRINNTAKTLQYTFTGKYGADLIKEVQQYAMVAMQIARDNEFDIIHAHDWLTYQAGIVAKEISGKPLVVHVHATEFDRSGEHVNQDVYNIERAGFHAADTIIAVSRLTRRILIDRYDVPPHKVVVVHNAVVPRSKVIYKKENLLDKQIVTFLGRITFQKGPDYFVEAAKKVLEQLPDVHFVMAGHGDMYIKLVERVAELRMSSRFHFTGFLNSAETDKMYGMTNVYVMPSVSEPFGITPLEAMRSGVPVIISNQSGVAEVLKYVIKVDFWDTNILADSICGLLNYPKISKTLAEEGYKEVDGLKWEYAALRVKEVYQETLNQLR
ncbi:MAG: glycosyltransferase family 4 protein [Bacteroidetes bacterium]|nr:glycosyltransferase family 4 protein [Bacteroidota bacterium]